MREPIRLLTVLAILMGGLFGLKTLSVANGASDWWAAQAQTAQDQELAEEHSPEGEAEPEFEQTPVDGLPDLYEEPPVCEVQGDSGEFAERLASRGLSPQEQDVLRTLARRRSLLDDRAAEMETREAMALAVEQRLDERIEALRILEVQINSLVGELTEREAEDMDDIVAWYAEMDSGAAAERMEQLSPDYQIQIASRMRPAKFAEIIGEMVIPAAASLTENMANRSSLPQTAADLEVRLNEDGGATQ